jgi:hypothetical protein
VLKADVRSFSRPLRKRRKQAGAHQVRHPVSRIQPQKLPRHVEPFAKFGYHSCESYTRVLVSAFTSHCLYRSLLDLTDYMERRSSGVSDSCLSIQVVPCPLKNPKVQCHIHSRCPPSHLNPVHTSTSYFFKII